MQIWKDWVLTFLCVVFAAGGLRWWQNASLCDTCTGEICQWVRTRVRLTISLVFFPLHLLFIMSIVQNNIQTRDSTCFFSYDHWQLLSSYLSSVLMYWRTLLTNLLLQVAIVRTDIVPSLRMIRRKEITLIPLTLQFLSIKISFVLTEVEKSPLLWGSTWEAMQMLMPQQL